MTVEEEIMEILIKDSTHQFRTVRWVYEHMKTKYHYGTVRKCLRKLYEKGCLECIERVIIMDCYPRDDRKPFKLAVKVKLYRFD